MTDKLIDYSDDDIIQLKNPEKSFYKKIQSSINMTKVVLFSGKKFLNDNITFITIPETSQNLGIERGYLFQLFDSMIGMGILEQRKTKNERRARYFLKDEQKLRKAIEIAKTNLL